VTRKTSVTLKTIAQELGVSVTTVARALNGGERLSASTTEKVLRVAQQLGYVRNLDGVKLRTGKTFVVMAFLGVPTEEEIGDSGSVGLLNGIHKRLSTSDYAVRVTPVSLQENGFEGIKQVVDGHSADGIILDHTTPEDERVKFLNQANIPFVTFGRTLLAKQHPYFDIDNKDAAYQGTCEMIRLGYQRIALIEANSDYTFVSQRVAGYKQALRAANIQFDSTLIKHLDQCAPQSYTAVEALLSVHVDAFVCANELLFMGARAGLRNALGDQCHRFGFSLRSGTNLCAYLNTKVSTSFYSRVDAGWNLADLLLQQIAGAPVSESQAIVKTALRNF